MPTPPRRKATAQQLEFLSAHPNGEDADLLRASPLCRVLAGGARVFASSSGTGADFHQSRPVTSIDVFISHNWAVGRWSKYVALSLHFNAWLAWALCLSSKLLVAALNVTPAMPSAVFPGADYPEGFSCSYLPAPLFLLAIFSGCTVAQLLGLAGKVPCVFLDKTCIHQVDKEIQKRGIRKLGAFLYHSRYMLVLYTDLYLRKLWTVYELACFLSLHSVDDIIWVPTIVPCTIVCMVCQGWLGLVVGSVLEFSIGFAHGLEVVFVVLGGVVCASLFRAQARARQMMLQHSLDFSVEESTCQNEEDRALVYHNIVELMKAVEAVPPGAGQGEGLAAFNSLVRSKLPILAEAATNINGLRYKDMMIISFMLFDPLYCDGFVGLRHGMPVSRAANMTIVALTFCLAVVPLTMGCLARLMNCCLHLHGALDKAFAWVVGMLSMLTGGTLYALLRFLWLEGGFGQCQDAPLMALLSVLSSLSLGALAVCTYCPAGFLWSAKRWAVGKGRHPPCSF